MRIAHVTATFPPYLAGTGYVAYYQSRELARLGHEIHVFTVAHKGTQSERTAEGVVVHRLPPLVQIGNAHVLPRLLQIHNFDLVHLHYPFISGAEFIWAVCRGRGIPYVVNYHNDLIGVGLRAAIFQIYKTLFSRLVLRDAARYLAVTVDHALHCQLSPIFQQYQDRLVELNNGVDIEHFTPLTMAERQAVRHQIFGDPELRVVMFVGALDAAHHFKGLSTLIRAWKEIDCHGCRLVIIGDGDRRSTYEQAVHQAGLRNVRFVGKVPHQDLPRYYAVADVVVLPSTPPESFGIVLIEGMACGIPVIGSRIPGVRRVVDEGENGILVPPNSPPALAGAIERILKMALPERRAIGAAGRRKAELLYSWRQIARHLAAIYADVLELPSDRQ